MKQMPLAAAAAALLMCLASPARASDYPLSSVLKEAAAARLEKEKILTTGDLLARAATPPKRKALAKRTGLSRGKITRWARLCDLLRVKGVGLKMARLLTMAGVETVRGLRKEQPLALHRKVVAANKDKEVTKTPPTAEQLFNWITQARKLKLVLR